MIDKDEIKKRIAELEPIAEKAWSDFSSYETSEEYRTAQAKYTALSDAWIKPHRSIEALKTLLDDNQR